MNKICYNCDKVFVNSDAEHCVECGKKLYDVINDDELYEKLNSTSPETLKAFYSILGSTKQDIDYVLKCYDKKDIVLSLDEAYESMEFLKSLDDLDDYTVKFLYVNFKLPRECSSRSSRIEYLENEISVSSLKYGIALAREKEDLYKKLNSLPKDVFEELLSCLDMDDELQYKYEKVIYAIISNDEEYILNHLDSINSRNSIKKSVSALKKSEYELLIDDLDSRNDDLSKKETIEYISLNYSYEMIEERISRIKEKIAFKDELKKLDKENFSLLASSLELKDDTKAKQINYLISNYEIDELKSKVDEIVEKSRLRKQLDEMDVEPFSYLFNKYGDLNLALIKDEKIDYLLKNLDVEELEYAISEALETFEIRDMLSSLDDEFLEELFKLYDFSKKGVSKETKIRSLAINFTREQIDNKIDIAKDKIALKGELNDLDDYIFRFVSCLKSKDYSSKDLIIDDIVYNNSRLRIYDEIKAIESNLDKYKKLDELDFTRFKLLEEQVVFPEGCIRRDSKISYLAQTKSMDQIDYKLDKIEAYVNEIREKLSENDYVYERIVRDIQIPENLERDEKIDYLIANISKSSLRLRISYYETENEVRKTVNGILSFDINDLSCPNCGKFIGFRDKYCKHCGSELK
ncbi:zinc ribbon domain-containing protein [uncultured Methanobrevibacter sp.]|uniref:zinc ribbon domain-containing protein n=1 Tax=uncultured Methanobrevibacter sp. TaxID=253161 RepID=UPI002603B69C